MSTDDTVFAVYMDGDGREAAARPGRRQPQRRGDAADESLPPEHVADLIACTIAATLPGLVLPRSP